MKTAQAASAASKSRAKLQPAPPSSLSGWDTNPANTSSRFIVTEDRRTFFPREPYWYYINSSAIGTQGRGSGIYQFEMTVSLVDRNACWFGVGKPGFADKVIGQNYSFPDDGFMVLAATGNTEHRGGNVGLLPMSGSGNFLVGLALDLRGPVNNMYGYINNGNIFPIIYPENADLLTGVYYPAFSTIHGDDATSPLVVLNTGQEAFRRQIPDALPWG